MNKFKEECCHICGYTSIPDFEDNFITEVEMFPNTIVNMCMLCHSKHTLFTNDVIYVWKVAGTGTVPLLISSHEATAEGIRDAIECKETLTKVHKCTYQLIYQNRSS